MLHICDVAGCEEGFESMADCIAHERSHHSNLESAAADPSSTPSVMSVDPDVIKRLEAEWRHIREDFTGWPSHRRRYGVRWVLINVFGNDEQFQFDPTFHAQVSRAEQLLDLLINLAATSAVDEARQRSIKSP